MFNDFGFWFSKLDIIYQIFICAGIGSMLGMICTMFGDIVSPEEIVTGQFE